LFKSCDQIVWFIAKDLTQSQHLETAKSIPAFHQWADHEGPCSFKENEDVWTKDEEKLGKQSIRFNNTLKQFKGFTALTDLKMNILSELVFRQEKKCYREIYWLNECLKAKNEGKGDFWIDTPYALIQSIFSQKKHQSTRKSSKMPVTLKLILKIAKRFRST
jgi:hypothetical protein